MVHGSRRRKSCNKPSECSRGIKNDSFRFSEPRNRPRRDQLVTPGAVLLSADAASFQPRALRRAVGAHVKWLRHAVAPQIQRVVRMPGLGARRSGVLEVKTEYGLLDFYAGYGAAHTAYDDRFRGDFCKKAAGRNKFSIWIQDKKVHEEYANMDICPSLRRSDPLCYRSCDYHTFRCGNGFRVS